MAARPAEPGPWLALRRLSVGGAGPVPVPLWATAQQGPVLLPGRWGPSCRSEARPTPACLLAPGPLRGPPGWTVPLPASASWEVLKARGGELVSPPS